MLIRPQALQRGDVVAVVAPAGRCSPELLREAQEGMQDWGWVFRFGETACRQYGYLAGEDELRAAELNASFADPEVRAIFCLRGGYGSMRILERLDYDLIRRHPKLLVGYSDITALHTAIHQRTGLVTIHGPLFMDWAKDKDGLTWRTLRQLMTANRPRGRYREGEVPSPLTLVPGTAEGPLVGGNLTLLCATLGTPYEIDTKGKILFLEEVGEAPYRVDRMLTQLRLAGKLQEAAGILLGDFQDCEAPSADSLSLEEVFRDVLGGLGVPCFWGWSSGHGPRNVALAIGVRVRMDADQGQLELLEPAVC